MSECYAIVEESAKDGLHVYAVFSSRDTAIKEAPRYGENVYVTTFPLDFVLPPNPPGMSGWYATKNYVDDCVLKPNIPGIEVSSVCDFDMWAWAMFTSSIGVVRKTLAFDLCVYLWARDEKHALELATALFAEHAQAAEEAGAGGGEGRAIDECEIGGSGAACDHDEGALGTEAG